MENLQIIELKAENYQRLRVIAIRPDGRPVVMLTGKNGQGKSSVLDSIWFALKGTEAFKHGSKTSKGNSGIVKDRRNIIRNGAESTVVKLVMRDGTSKEVTVTRRMGQSGNQPALTVEGRNEMKPQQFLDSLLDALAFDPLDFIRMDPLEQVDQLKKLGKVTLDFEALDKANEDDYKERTIIGRERDTLQNQLAGMSVLAGLPKEKLDEAAIFERLNRAGETNDKAQQLTAEKQRLGAIAAQLGLDKGRKQGEAELIEAEIQKLQAALKLRGEELKTLEKQRAEAEAAFQAAPKGAYVDTAALMAELKSAQDTNRAIDARHRWDQIKIQIDQKEHVYQRLTNQMSVREEKKKEAISSAKIPIPGLTFDSTFVRFDGIALGNLSGAEQLRIATLIGMASNPKLRIICIRQGEALDEDGLKAIAALAEEHKFQVWMARVDSSGKCGIVIEDGMVTTDNDRDKQQVKGE